MATPTGPRLRVLMLERFELASADGGDLTPPRGKLRALVALLALAPAAGWSREQLTDLLWGGRNEEQARGSLRQALAELRRTLGVSALLTDREIAAFDPAVVSIDAVEFARLAAVGELDKAAALYRGELLEGVSLPDLGFADWLLVERTRLHDLAVGVLTRLLETQSSDVAICTAQRLLRLDPTREETHRALMQLYAAKGDRSQALRQYQICRDILQRNLDIEPEQETEQLYEEIHASTRCVAAARRRTPENIETAHDVAANAPQNDRLPSWEMPASRRSVTSPSRWPRLGASPSATPVVAVLPFDSLPDTAASRRLADGLTEDVITDLARFPEFGVIARDSTKIYPSSPVTRPSSLIRQGTKQLDRSLAPGSPPQRSQRSTQGLSPRPACLQGSMDHPDLVGASHFPHP